MSSSSYSDLLISTTSSSSATTYNPQLKDKKNIWINFGLKVQGWCNPTTFLTTEATVLIMGESIPITLGLCPRMMQSYHILEDRSHWIDYGRISPYHFRTFSKDYAIPLHSRRPRSPDHFTESAQGWYNPVTFSRTEVTGSIIDRCPGMIQSLFILEDRGLRVTLGQVSRDDTIPLQHHYSPFRGRSFWTTPSLSRKCLKFTRDRGFVNTSTTCSLVLRY